MSKWHAVPEEQGMDPTSLTKRRNAYRAAQARKVEVSRLCDTEEEARAIAQAATEATRFRWAVRRVEL